VPQTVCEKLAVAVRTIAPESPSTIANRALNGLKRSTDMSPSFGVPTRTVTVRCRFVRLARPLEPPRRNAGEHLFQHEPAERIPVGEVPVGPKRHLPLVIRAPHPRTVDLDAPTLSARSPSLAEFTSSPSASCTRGGNPSSPLASPVATCSCDTVFMAVPPPVD
jgi:hypothetical protein